MSRFTIFTIILAISVITILADVVVRDYFGEGQASVLMDSSEAPEVLASSVSAPSPAPGTQTDAAHAPFPVIPSPVPEPPAEPIFLPIPTPPLLLTPEKIKEAGFDGNAAEKHFDGKVYQLLDITKIPVDNIGFYEISAEGGSIASIAEIVLRDEIRALETYVLLQNKTKPYIDLSLNETNAYGDRSFYINHAKKPNEAFLTVKIKNRLYAIAYVKFYHPEIKKLIQMLIPF